MARNLFARLFHRDQNPQQPAAISPTVSAPAPAMPSAAPNATTATPVVESMTVGIQPVAANDVTERQCVSCGRDLTVSQTVCPSCGMALQATAVR